MQTFNKVWDRLSAPRPRRAAGGYILGQPEKDLSEEDADDTNINHQSNARMTARYRFRDLLLGDFSFNDDGER